MIQVPVPEGVEGLDIYIGVALTLFVFDRMVYLFKNFKSNGNGNSMGHKVDEIHDWLSSEDPKTGVKVWRLPAYEIRALRETLERLAIVVEANTKVMDLIQSQLEQRQL